jgi:putative flippase GtrA
VISAPASFLVAFASPLLFVYLGLDEHIAMYIGLLTVFTFNFVLNALFVFDRAINATLLFKYGAVALLFRTMDGVLFTFLYGAFIHRYELAILAALVTTFLIKYFVYKLIVFK